MIIDGDNQDKFDVSLAELEKMLGGGLTAGTAAPAEQQLAAVDAVDWDAVLSAVDAPVGTTGTVSETPASAEAVSVPAAEVPEAALTPDAELDALLGKLGSPATDELPVELPEQAAPMPEQSEVPASAEAVAEPAAEVPEAALTPDAELDALLGKLGSPATDELPVELPEPAANVETWDAVAVPEATAPADENEEEAPPAWGAAEAGIDTLSPPVLPVAEQEKLAAALSGLTAGAAAASVAGSTPSAPAPAPALPARTVTRPAPPPAPAPGLPPEKQVLACLKAGMFREAQELLKQLIVASPANADHYFNLSVACQRLHDRAGARAALERCLELDPHQYRAMCNLAGLYYEEGDLAGAQELLEQAVSINPFDTHSANNLRLIRRQRSGTLREKRRVRR